MWSQNFVILTLEPLSHVRMFLSRLAGEANGVGPEGRGGGGRWGRKACVGLLAI